MSGNYPIDQKTLKIMYTQTIKSMQIYSELAHAMIYIQPTFETFKLAIGALIVILVI